jgi:hypothetical protein
VREFSAPKLRFGIAWQAVERRMIENLERVSPVEIGGALLMV